MGPEPHLPECAEIEGLPPPPPSLQTQAQTQGPLPPCPQAQSQAQDVAAIRISTLDMQCDVSTTTAQTAVVHAHLQITSVDFATICWHLLFQMDIATLET